MRRREFIALVGCGVATAWPAVVHAESQPMPVIGILNTSAPEPGRRRIDPSGRLRAFHKGLNEGGYIEGKNVRIEIRWANGANELPALAADLVHRRVDSDCHNGGNASALAAKTATSTIPIVFTTGDDPVRAGLVASLSRPGGNITGMSLHSTDLVEKRLELLHELVPSAKSIALLAAAGSETQFSTQHAKIAARAYGLNVLVCEATANSNFEEVMSPAVQQGAQALLVSAVPYFTVRRADIIAFAAHHRLPAFYPLRVFSDFGGLISYGPDLSEAYYQVGSYAARILAGAAPSDLPVQLPTRVELIINLGTARELGLSVPRLLQARANKIIE